MGNTSSHHRNGGSGGVSSINEKSARGEVTISRNDQAMEGDRKSVTEAGTKLVNNHQDRLQHRKRSSILGGGDKEGEGVLVRPEPLTERQKELLTETWKELETNIAKVGVITFISLFETHPDVQQVFMPFKGIELEDLKHSKQLRAHALRYDAGDRDMPQTVSDVFRRQGSIPDHFMWDMWYNNLQWDMFFFHVLGFSLVMAFVQKAVARLYEPEKLETLLQELGKKHYSYGAKQKFVDLIGPQFIQAIQPSLEERWTPELHDAWIQLFKYMAYVMKTSMSEEEQRVSTQQ